ncbi:oligopeptide transporter 2 [Trichomonascus vanleenenianus]|uniref:Opt2p n=1 Tax=Trichomonascus vanleenenianus TaxID=2268995 RepID=UPI003ECA8FCA
MEKKRSSPMAEKSTPSPTSSYQSDFSPASKAKILELLGLNGYDTEKPDLRFLYHEIASISNEEVEKIIREAVAEHTNDINFPHDVYEKMKKFLEDGSNSFDARVSAVLIKFHSPYPEVRSVTDPFDEPDIPVDTLRAYFIGLFWSIIGAGVNTFFNPRMPNISLSNPIIQVLSYPCGCLLAKITPNWRFKLFGKEIVLNPGPWTYKEQMFSTIIFSVANGGAYAAIYNVFVQRLDVYYGDKWATFGFQLLLVISTQFLGFGLAGILRRLVVYPVKAMWPTLLPVIALNRALAVKEPYKEKINGWSFSRYRLFVWAFIITFIYFWIPSYLFEAFANFNWMCWIRPNSFNVNALTGTTGIGLNPISTFDPNIILYSNPMSTPFFTQVNMYVGLLIAGVVIIPAIYWTNYKFTGYLPINSNRLFDNRAQPYNVKRVLTNGLFDEEKYQNYSLPYYTAANLVTYGGFFVLYPLAIIDTFVTHGTGIIQAFKDVATSVVRRKRTTQFENNHDPHCRMMSQYKEVPDWWFFVILVVSLTCGILAVKLYPTDTPVWGIFFSLGINFLFLIPITIIYSITGFSFGLNVLVELIVGLVIPGSGTALMLLKAFGYNIDGQAQNFISDQKMGHYAKIPPRALFTGQLLATMCQVFVCLGVVNWQLTSIKDICQPHQASRFTCPNTNSYFAASIAWGVIGPKIVFKGIYPILQWCFLLGALLPIPLYFGRRWFPTMFRYFQPTVMLGGMFSFAPYSAVHYTEGFYVGLTFMYYIKRRFPQWWGKYNYVLYSAISAGLGLAAIIIFFAVQYYPRPIVWWGNTVSENTIDGGLRGPNVLYPLPEKGYFGPEPGKLPTRGSL